MKRNAKEYLKEFANSKDDWLKALIYEAIETNGEILEEKKEKIYKNLSQNEAITISEPNINDNYSDIEIYISSLKYISGVGALKENQIIKFDNNVTILYGLNGAGKSSYFKILNEIVGGNQKKEILSNIYLDTQQPINVEISFKKKDEPIQKVNWNGNTRSIDLLNKCKVFDTSYLNGLLTVRQADATLIQPLGLNLFPYLVNLIDEFKEKLNNEADKIKLEKPTIELQNFREEFKRAFKNHLIDKNLKEKIENLYDFSEENLKKLEKLQENLSNLKQTNLQDKIKLLNNDKNEILTIKNSIESINKNLKEFIEKTLQTIKIYNEAVKQNKLAKEQFKILSDIPKNDTKEWKEFIKAGKKYNDIIDDKKKCPYCRQPLRDDSAVKLIEAYGKFLQDESEQKLNQSILSIESLIKDIEKISILTIKKDWKELFEKYIEDSNFFQNIISIMKNFLNIKNQLLDGLKNKLNSDYKSSNIEEVTKKLSSIVNNIQSTIDKLSSEQEKKEEQIKQLEEQIEILLENKSISSQRNKINEWFEKDQKERILREKASKINTRKISELSKKAHNELLTETLKNKFIEELTELGYKNLDINLENARGQKGVTNTKLTLIKNNDVKVILSEGEQKAVALALFIAEIKIQKTNNPIILDDPVNSLDHRIAGRFAERLLKLDNQIILFTHNKLFLNAFESIQGSHICKNIDGGCNKEGKHIRIYKVDSDGKNIKGVLTNYKQNKAINHIKDVKQKLRKSPFEEYSSVASLIRKSIECIIDEVIFNNQIPTKYSHKNSRINWDKLKNLKTDIQIIDKLKEIHSRVSGGELHNGTENEENPIEKEEFEEMIYYLKNILSKNN